MLYKIQNPPHLLIDYQLCFKLNDFRYQHVILTYEIFLVELFLF